MGKKSSAQFIKELSGKDNVEEAKKVVEQVFKGGLKNLNLLQSMGVITIVVTAEGAFQYSMSPFLENTLVGIEMTDQALRDVQEKVIVPRRRKMIEQQLENKEKKKTIEDNEEE